MNRETVIRKLESIVSRVDLAPYMHIDEIYLFGSALYKEEPRDVDVQIRYHMTEMDGKEYKEYFKSKVENLPICRQRNHDWEHIARRVLRSRMKHVDIQFADPSFMRTQAFLLVWSREKQNIRKNLTLAGWGTPIAKLIGEEPSNLRQQLKWEREKRIVLESAVRIMRNIVPLSKKQEIDVVIAVLYNVPNAEVEEEQKRKILQDSGFPEKQVVALRRRGSKVIYCSIDRIVFWKLI